MEHPPTRLHFSAVDAECRTALANASRTLTRNERYAVEVILDLTYAIGRAELAVTCSEDLSDALEVGGRQNLHPLLRRLRNMKILRWDESTGSPSVNPHPRTWLVGPSIPASVERATRATAARARLLAHQRMHSAQGEFFPEPTVAEWEAEEAQERASSQMPPEASSVPLPPEIRNENYDERRGSCHSFHDKGAGVRHENHDGSSPHARARQNHDDVAESNHVHGSDARGADIADALEGFFVEGGIPPEVVTGYRRTWSRRILDKPLRVERCLHEAKAFRDAGGRPKKTWGHYLNYLFELRQNGDKAAAVKPSKAEPVATGSESPAAGESIPEQERQRRVAEWRESNRQTLSKGGTN